jgi:mannose-6-phosphate isomerase-like protein (cupin superfamily)
MNDFNSVENLERIRRMTESPIVMPLIELAHLIGKTVTYDCDQGSCTGVCLLNTEAVAVQYATLGPGTKFKPHQHGNELEYLIVISGELYNIIGEITERIPPGGSMLVPMGTTHWVYTFVETHVVAITIPAAEGYPK